MAEVSPVLVEFKLPRFVELSVTLVGKTPLLCNKMGDQEREKIEANQKSTTKSRKKSIVDPHQKFQGSVHLLPDGAYGFPSIAVKEAMETASREMKGVYPDTIKAAIEVLDVLMPLNGPVPQMFSTVAVSHVGKTPKAIVTYRSMFVDWKAEWKVSVNIDILPLDKFWMVLFQAGRYPGIGSWRPENNGIYGKFIPKV